MKNENCKLKEAEVMTPDELSERLINFAARVGKVVDALPDTRMGRHIAGQFVRCGTSPAPNYEEACAAESRADFIHKLGICLKELRESRCWVRLIIKTELLPEHRMNELLDEANELCNIIGQSIVTAKENRDKKR
ncbi:MAG: four helix bundle protein [Acidobacteriota bacterium]